MLYHWLGWISFGFCIILLMKFIARISKIKAVNKAFRKIHKPLGIAVIVTGTIHGIISIIKHPQDIIGLITGVFLWTLIVFFAITYLAKSKLKSKWFLLHRIASIMLIIISIVHFVFVIVY